MIHKTLELSWLLLLKAGKLWDLWKGSDLSQVKYQWANIPDILALRSVVFLMHCWL